MTTRPNAAPARPESHAVGLACDSDEPLDDLASRFYDRYDGVLACRDGSYVVTQFVTESTGFRAGRQAVQDVESVGFRVRKVDRDLVDTSEVAARLDVTRQAVNHWADGRRANDFPPPLGSPGGKRIWAWSQIVPWAQARGKAIDELRPLSLDDSARLDVWLLERRNGHLLRSVGKPVVADETVGVKGVYKSAGSDMYLQSSRNWLLEQ